MRPSPLLVIALVAAVVAAAGPSARAASGTASASPAPSGAPAVAASPAATIDTKNFAYAPADATVSVGSTVKFTNSDPLAHTVTAADGTFDSGDMAQGASWSHVFAKAGTYAYYCGYHRYMKGTITVK